MLSKTEHKLLDPTINDIAMSIMEITRNNKGLPSERTLAELLVVKRHQLRKALAYLRETGKIEKPRPRNFSKPNKNLVEHLTRITNPLEILELRLLLEPGFARLATLRASAHEIENILELASTKDNQDRSAVDLKFHEAIALGAHNRLGMELFSILRRVCDDGRVAVSKATTKANAEPVSKRDAEHLMVAEAIAHRDPDAATDAMQAHLISVRQKIVDRTDSEFRASAGI